MKFIRSFSYPSHPMQESASGNYSKNTKQQIKRILTVWTLVGLTGCMINYPKTTFYVKNTTNKTLHFKASVNKHNSMGKFEMTLPFAVQPNDSILARQTNLHKDAPPTTWFTKFTIFPTDSVVFNDPNNASNWVKSLDKKGRPVYIFNMTK